MLPHKQEETNSKNIVDRGIYTRESDPSINVIIVNLFKIFIPQLVTAIVGYIMPLSQIIIAGHLNSEAI